jgi:hypothetical protein
MGSMQLLWAVALVGGALLAVVVLGVLALVRCRPEDVPMVLKIALRAHRREVRRVHVGSDDSGDFADAATRHLPTCSPCHSFGPWRR